MKKLFTQFASKVAQASGSSWAFVGAFLLIVAWAISGPFFNFSDTWELVINTLTTIVTFLMVFLIQNAQNRDTKAVHLKLDELIKVTKDARDSLLDAEDMTEKELLDKKREFQQLSK